MDKLPNFYEILHVLPDSPLAVIKASYRALMQVCRNHPDLGGDTEYASLLNQAYNTLKCTNSRQQYDEELMRQNFDIVDDIMSKNQHPSPPKNDPIIDKPNSDTIELNLPICPFCETPHGFDASLDPNALCHKCKMPLFMSDSRIEEYGLRQFMRIPKGGMIYYYLHWPGSHYKGELHDLSPKGISFLCNEALAIGQHIIIEANEMYAIAEVTNSRDCESHQQYHAIVGARFIDVYFNTQYGNFISTRA